MTPLFSFVFWLFHQIFSSLCKILKGIFTYLIFLLSSFNPLKSTSCINKVAQIQICVILKYACFLFSFSPLFLHNYVQLWWKFCVICPVLVCVATFHLWNTPGLFSKRVFFPCCWGAAAPALSAGQASLQRTFCCFLLLQLHSFAGFR